MFSLKNIIALLTALRSFWPKVKAKYLLDIPQRYMTMQGLPATTGVFSPFFKDRVKGDDDAEEDDEETVWSRDEDWARFQAHMKRNVHSHTILTGPSGSGKSTFLTRIVKRKLKKRLIFNNSYFDFISTFILLIPQSAATANQLDRLTDAIKGYLEAPIELSMSRVLQDTSEFPVPDKLKKLGDDAEQYVRDALADKPVTYFVFDQIERFLSEVKHLQSKPDRAAGISSIYIIIRVLKTLRQLDNTRTIFAIRADALFDSIDFLTYSLDRLEEADRVFQYFYFNGINITTSPTAIGQISRLYGTHLPVDWARFKTFTSLNSKSMSNTFLIQLSGYMLENFSESDPRVADTVLKKGKSPSDFLPLFFEHLIAGFHQSSDGLINHNIFKAVALTIAVENRVAGEAITRERISRLSHIPQHYVEPVVDYLLSRNVLKPDRYLGSDYVRFSHDLLFDYIVEAPEFQGRDDLHKGIERLAEHRVSNDSLIHVPTYGNFLEELGEWQVPAWSTVIYWLFASVLAISSTLQLLPLPQEFKKWEPWLHKSCKGLFDGYNAVLNWLFHYLPFLKPLFVVTDCTAIGHYSAAIAIMHAVWLWYIYKLDRGYFQYVFVDRPGWRKCAAGLVPLGAALGILVGFAPNLCVVPITIVGLGMAVILKAAKHEVGKASEFGKLNSAWGTRTAVNMLLMTLLMVNLHSFMVSPLAAYVDASKAMESELVFLLASPADTIFWATAVFLIWFWAHIRPGQQSAISMAARLTQFDVARNSRPPQLDAAKPK